VDQWIVLVTNLTGLPKAPFEISKMMDVLLGLILIIVLHRELMPYSCCYRLFITPKFLMLKS
jgi:hypothetical protein